MSLAQFLLDITVLGDTRSVSLGDVMTFKSFLKYVATALVTAVATWFSSHGGV